MFYKVFVESLNLNFVTVCEHFLPISARLLIVSTRFYLFTSRFYQFPLVYYLLVVFTCLGVISTCFLRLPFTFYLNHLASHSITTFQVKQRKLKKHTHQKMKKIQEVLLVLQTILNDLYQFVVQLNTLNSKIKLCINSETCLSYFGKSICKVQFTTAPPHIGYFENTFTEKTKNKNENDHETVSFSSRSLSPTDQLYSETKHEFFNIA